MADSEQNKTVTYVAGGALGLLVGLAAAHMYARTAEEQYGEVTAPQTIDTGDAFKIGLALVALVRQISDLAVKKP
jgi:hypothetical protein